MASFGVASTFGLTAPSGYLQSSEESVDVEVATIKGATGQVVEAIPKPRSTTTVNIKTKGDAALSTVVTGNFTALSITSSKFSQSNDDFSTSEITGTFYE